MLDLSLKSRIVYKRLQESTRYVTIDGENLIVYIDRILDGEEDSIFELIEKGYLDRVICGKRKVLVLGEWNILDSYYGDESVSEPEEIERLMSRYYIDQRRTINKAFECFATLRKKQAIADSVKLVQLKAYSTYPADVVIEGLKKYIDMGHYLENKNERYAIGIIKGLREEQLSGRIKPIKFNNPQSSKWADREQQVKDLQDKKLARRKIIDKMVKEKLKEKGLSINSTPSSVLSEIMKEVELEIAPL